MAANTKQCSFNTGLSYELTSDNRFVYYYNSSNINLVSEDQCQIKPTYSTSIQFIYWCNTWEDDFFDPCCSDPIDTAVRDLCSEVLQNMQPGIIKNWNILVQVCRNGPVQYPRQFLWDDCCARQPEVAEPCRAVQQAGLQYMVALYLLYEACGYNSKDLSDVCPNNCRGVNSSDIIAGGAALFATSALLATPPLTAVAPVLATAAATAFGLLGLGAGAMTAQQLCAGPLYCRRGPQCCTTAFDATRMGFFCPPSC